MTGIKLMRNICMAQNDLVNACKAEDSMNQTFLVAPHFLRLLKQRRPANARLAFRPSKCTPEAQTACIGCVPVATLGRVRTRLANARLCQRTLALGDS